jgi:UDP-4-amino-4-deoxy-L-arabinose-oxoglutarate aminotransferase
MKVEFYKHDIEESDIRAVSAAMRAPILTTGQTVYEFEKRFAEYTSNEFAIGLMSGTHALELALRLYDIGQGDEVITTPLSFIATSNAIIQAGAHPIFVDVETSTGNIDADLIEQAITAKTRALLIVHLYGVMCDIKKLRAIADKYHLILIEDAAHCIEGSREGFRSGNLGDVACFSFYATKNITSGEGGAISVHHASQAELLRTLSLHGMDKSAEKRYQNKYQHWDMKTLGHKANMSNIQAAMLLGQLERLDDQWEKREKICRIYEHAFSEMKGVSFPVVPQNAKSARHLFTIWVEPSRRDEILLRLQEQGVGVAVNYRAIHLLQYYREKFGFKRGDYPQAEHIGDSTITLPLYSKLTDKEIKYVIEAVKKALD